MARRLPLDARLRSPAALNVTSPAKPLALLVRATLPAVDVNVNAPPTLSGPLFCVMPVSVFRASVASTAPRRSSAAPDSELRVMVASCAVTLSVAAWLRGLSSATESTALAGWLMTKWLATMLDADVWPILAPLVALAVSATLKELNTASSMKMSLLVSETVFSDRTSAAIRMRSLTFWLVFTVSAVLFNVIGA